MVMRASSGRNPAGRPTSPTALGRVGCRSHKGFGPISTKTADPLPPRPVGCPAPARRATVQPFGLRTSEGPASKTPGHEDRAEDTAAAATDLFRAMAARKSSHLQAINCGPLTGMSARGAREAMRMGARAQKSQQSLPLPAADLFCRQKKISGDSSNRVTGAARSGDVRARCGRRACPVSAASPRPRSA